MEPWLRGGANAASAHADGRAARAAVEAARAEVAALLGVPTRAVVFTSGATEAHHLGLVGRRPASLAVAAGVHPSMRFAVRTAVPQAIEWPLDAHGRLVPRDDAVSWVAIEHAHHETGLMQDAAALAALRGRARLHLDLCVGLDRVAAPPFDQAVLSAHKIGGPQGIGALAAHDVDAIEPLWPGGAAERGKRPGTVPVALAVGFGAAARFAATGREERSRRLTELDADLVSIVCKHGGRVAGDGGARVPGHLAALFPGWRGDTLAAALDLQGVCASAGAACASGAPGPSAALRAMGDPAPDGILRLSLGPESTPEDVWALEVALDRIGVSAASPELR
jgi:cysteine desulfurase